MIIHILFTENIYTNVMVNLCVIFGNIILNIFGNIIKYPIYISLSFIYNFENVGFFFSIAAMTAFIKSSLCNMPWFQDI